jgi:hypothetical protein
MELTKFERRVLDSKYRQRCIWYSIVPGVVFIAIGVSVAFYGNAQSKEIEGMWKQNMASVMEFVPSTGTEKQIHDIAVRSTDAARIGWTGFIEEKSKGTAKLFMIVGAFLVGLYFREIRYKRLIEKIGAPNQAL